ncbi:MAG: hypothetical protein R3B48_16315 [Kofleriaceae bacterium]
MHASLRLTLTLALFGALPACGDDLAAPLVELPAARARAVIVTGDFNATGVLSVIDATDGAVRQNAVAGAAGADPVIRKLGDELFVVNRFGPTGSNVTVLDARSLAVTHQLSTGTNSNPQDVAVAGDELFLPALETAGVVVLQRNGVRSLIDLSGLDPDGKPDCSSIYAVDDKLIIVCGLLENFSVVRDAAVVLYDPKTKEVRTSALAARNPVGFLQATPADSVFGGELLVATADYADPTSQCVVRIDPRTGASRCALANADLGGIASRLEVAAEQGVLFVTPTYYDGPALRGALRPVDLSSGAIGASLSAPTQAISDLGACPDGTLVTADGTFGASGIRLYKDGVEQTTAAVAVGLPPAMQNGIVCY